MVANYIAPPEIITREFGKKLLERDRKRSKQEITIIILRVIQKINGLAVEKPRAPVKGLQSTWNH